MSSIEINTPPRPAGIPPAILRWGTVAAVALHLAFLVWLATAIVRASDPRSDGFELVPVGIGAQFLFLPFSVPALVFALRGRRLESAAIMAGVATAGLIGVWFMARNSLGR